MGVELACNSAPWMLQWASSRSWGRLRDQFLSVVAFRFMLIFFVWLDVVAELGIDIVAETKTIFFHHLVKTPS